MSNSPTRPEKMNQFGPEAHTYNSKNPEANGELKNDAEASLYGGSVHSRYSTTTTENLSTENERKEDSSPSVVSVAKWLAWSLKQITVLF